MLKEFKPTFRIATPLIIGNITQMSLGLMDMAMVGSIDYVQLAAGAFVTNVLAIPTIIGIGLTTAMTPLIAIANGQNDEWSVSHYLYNGVILCTLIGILIALGIEIFNPIVNQMGQDPLVIQYSIPYIKIVGWSIIPMIFFLSMKQFCDALEYTEIAMFLSILALPINGFLNWIFIFGKLGAPRLELYGAGVGTILTRIIISIMLLVFILKSYRFKQYIQIRKSAWKVKWEGMKQLIKLGVPSSLQYGLEVGAFSLSGIMIGWFGATQQAAHQIALNLASFTFMIIMGISTAGSIRVSNAYGKNEIEKLRKIGYSTLLFGGGFGLCFALFFILFHNYLPYIFNQETAVVTLAGQLLIFAAVFQLSDSTQAIGVGLLRGIKDVKIPTFFVVIAYWIIGLPVGYFLGVRYDMKAAGMWIGLALGLTTSSLLLNFRFRHQSKKLEHLKNALVK